MDPVTWAEAIKSALVMIPKLVDLFARIGRQMAEKEFQAWMTELDSVTQKLENSKSLKERVDAAKRLSELARGM